MNVKIVVSPLDHAFYHMSLEEYFLKYDSLSRPILLLYVNRPCIVMGRNQNPWLECDLSAMAENGVVLARRTTGGGTVYHDSGNLNYALIYRTIQLSEQRIFDWIIESLKILGFHAEIGERKEILVNQFKVSGTAFGRYRDRKIQHGTLLVEADLSDLKRYLLGSSHIAYTKSVRSVPSPVINLNELNSEIHIQKITDTLVGTLDTDSDYMPQEDFYKILGSNLFRALLNKNESWSWLFGETPVFEMVHPQDYSKRYRIYKGKLRIDEKELVDHVLECMPHIHITA